MKIKTTALSMCFLCAITTLTGCNNSQSSSVSQTSNTEMPQKKATMSREAFKQAVLGKSQEQVIAAVGRPDTTQEMQDDRQAWYYNETTLDSITGKVDHHVQVWFAYGIVKQVNF